MHPDHHDSHIEAMSPMASVMADMPEVWQRLLDAHLPDAAGRCRACRNHGTAGVPWPCTLQVIAGDARTLHLAQRDAAELAGPPTIPFPALCHLAG